MFSLGIRQESRIILTKTSISRVTRHLIFSMQNIFNLTRRFMQKEIYFSSREDEAEVEDEVVDEVEGQDEDERQDED